MVQAGPSTVDLSAESTGSNLPTSGIDSDSKLPTSGLSDSSDVSNKSTGIFTLTNPLKVNSIGGLVQSLIEIVSYLAILFAVVMFIVVGFRYVLFAAQGNASKISELHKQLMWLIVGVAVIIAARVIVQVVINTLSATGVVSPEVIQSANKAASGQ